MSGNHFNGPSSQRVCEFESASRDGNVSDECSRRIKLMLRRLWKQWKVIAHKIGNFQSRVLLNIFYFSILMPFGLAVRLLSDPLHLKLQNHSHWTNKGISKTPWENARRQF